MFQDESWRIRSAGNTLSRPVHIQKTGAFISPQALAWLPRLARCLSNTSCVGSVYTGLLRSTCILLRQAYPPAVSCSLSPAFRHTFKHSFTVLVRYRTVSLYLVLTGVHLLTSCRGVSLHYSTPRNFGLRHTRLPAFTASAQRFHTDYVHLAAFCYMASPQRLAASGCTLDCSIASTKPVAVAFFS